MWKQGGRSSALERAQAALSSRRGRGTAAAALSTPPRVVSAQELPAEVLSSHSSSSLSSVSAHMDHRAGAAPVPNPKNKQASEVTHPLSCLESGANRFLKKTPAAASQGLPEERTVSSSLQRSQTAALSLLSQVENRFGKGAQKRSPSRVGQMAVQDNPEEETVLPRPSSARPGLDQPRRFVKSRPQSGLGGKGRLEQSDSSDRSAEESHSRQQLHSPAHLSITSPVQAHTKLSAPLGSPFSPTPSPPDLSPAVLSPSPHEPSPSPSELSPSPSGLSASAGSALGEVHSLEELFPLDEVSENTCENFQINLMELDELDPAPLQLEEDAGEKEDPPEEEPEEEEDYPSDFESVIQTESLSEHVQDIVRLPSPPLSEHIHDSVHSCSTLCSERTQDNSHSYSPPPSEHIQDSAQSYSPPSEQSYSKPSSSARSEASSPEAPISDTPLPHAKTPYARDRPGQTTHWPAHSGHCLSLELLMESLRQQLALTSQFISSSREHHARVLQNLGPPNYNYTTLQDTQEYIWKRRASKPRSRTLTRKK